MDTMQDLFKGFLRFRRNVESTEQDINTRFLDYCRRQLHLSSAQFFQDLFVLHTLGDKRNGYFVEFGACDGRSGSNSLMLEQQYDWNGIVAEPGRCWHEALKKNRHCNIDLRCVWDVSEQKLDFNEVTNPGLAGLSTVDSYTKHDGHGPLRGQGVVYSVDTISLNDLLMFHKAPQQIDYLSIDTEGSELRILQAFDFNRYDIKVITVEHNHTPQRQEIEALLTGKGFRRCFELFSAVDDWYVKD